MQIKIVLPQNISISPKSDIELKKGEGKPISKSQLVIHRSKLDQSDILQRCKSENTQTNFIKNLHEMKTFSKLYQRSHNEFSPEIHVDYSINLPLQIGRSKHPPHECRKSFSCNTKILLPGHWFIISKFIGEGSFGYVLLASSSSLAKDPIALKIDHKKRYCIWEAVIHSRVISIHQFHFC